MRWNSPETGSITLDPMIDDPAGWRLMPESPGYRAGPDGRDLGADPDQIRWRKTP